MCVDKQNVIGEAGAMVSIQEVFTALELVVSIVHSAVRPLVLPLSLLLFLQWPLRDLLHLYSREANDVAQILFSLYVSIAIGAATREQSHLAVDTFARHYSPGARLWIERIGCLLVLIPWSMFLLYESWPLIKQSVSQLESFPDTYNPGYFIVKLAAWILALMVFLQATIDAFRNRNRESD
jgi:TRAP-type mannitol/chloroaromatic compound transport system permease small subunit